jgi:hypothetical protein
MEETWSPDDWQAHCDLLCNERHAPGGYQRVPDTDRGDLGLEGFSVDGEGCGYQCYSTQKTEVGARYVAQRDKMTADLGKLVVNAKRLEKMIGAHPLRRWIFLVPVHDSKELILHARKKEAELRMAGLPFLAEDFAVVIQTEADFGKELAIVEGHGAATIGDLEETVEPAALERLEREEAEQVQTMDRKLLKIAADPTAAREQMLRSAVDGGNIREHLRRHHPQTGEQVARQLSIERRDVLAERELGELHSGSVTQVRRRLEARLQVKVTAVGDSEANRLSHAAVAAWLMECPLDFPEAR